MDLKIINSEFINIEDLEFIQELDTYELLKGAYEIYKHSTKNNGELSYEKARKKIIRNIILGQELPKRNAINYKRVFKYGNLIIHINCNEKTICYIKNIKSNININKKMALNNIMEIGD